jgi:ribosomal protein S18 acetylase RimI-like enzyme
MATGREAMAGETLGTRNSGLGTPRWLARREADPAVIRAFLERDLDWSAYALADLEEPLVRHARFYLAARDGVDGAALLVYQPPEFTVVELTGELGGAAALMAAAELPRETMLVLPTDHRDLVAAYYRGHGHGHGDRWDAMWRMTLRPEDLRLPDGVERAQRLTTADLPELRRFYGARDYDAPFSAEMVEHGVFCGVRRDGRLVAAAGTHVLARESRVAAIGNVYTAPEARGQGFASATTAAVARELLGRGCRRVILNVKADNAAAISVYRRIGFGKARDFWEVPHATLAGGR